MVRFRILRKIRRGGLESYGLTRAHHGSNLLVCLTPPCKESKWRHLAYPGMGTTRHGEGATGIRGRSSTEYIQLAGEMKRLAHARN